MSPLHISQAAHQDVCSSPPPISVCNLRQTMLWYLRNICWTGGSWDVCRLLHLSQHDRWTVLTWETIFISKFLPLLEIGGAALYNNDSDLDYLLETCSVNARSGFYNDHVEWTFDDVPALTFALFGDSITIVEEFLKVINLEGSTLSGRDLLRYLAYLRVFMRISDIECTPLTSTYEWLMIKFPKLRFRLRTLIWMLWTVKGSLPCFGRRWLTALVTGPTLWQWQRCCWRGNLFRVELSRSETDMNTKW